MTDGAAELDANTSDAVVSVATACEVGGAPIDSDGGESGSGMISASVVVLGSYGVSCVVPVDRKGCVDVEVLGYLCELYFW